MNGTSGCLSTDALIQLNIIDVNDEPPSIRSANDIEVSKFCLAYANVFLQKKVQSCNLLKIRYSLKVT